MSPAVKNALKSGISLAVVLGFVATWFWLSREVWQFKPSEGKPRLEVDPVFASLAGLLSTSVATATAAVLGFEARPGLYQEETWVADSEASAKDGLHDTRTAHDRLRQLRGCRMSRGNGLSREQT